MSFTASQLPLLGGRLSVDFVNATPPNAELSWELLIHFLESTDIVSTERGAQLLTLPQSDTQTAEALLLKSRRLGYALRKAFAAMLRKQKMAREWIDPVNEILRITEGHDELVGQDGAWRIEFIAREGGLDWPLAATAAKWPLSPASTPRHATLPSKPPLRRLRLPACLLHVFR